jgi:hypothetical protein
MACALQIRRRQRIQRRMRAAAPAGVMIAPGMIIPGFPGTVPTAQYMPQGPGMAPFYPNQSQYPGTAYSNSGRVSPIPQYPPYPPATSAGQPYATPYQAPSPAYAPPGYHPVYPGINQNQYAPSAPSAHDASFYHPSPNSPPAQAQMPNQQFQMNPVIQFK